MSADDARKLFVGGLGDAVGDVELRTFFEASGVVVEHVALPRDRETGRPRGFGFVTLASESDVQAAIQKLNGKVIAGRSLSIRPFSQDGPKRTGERPARGQDASLFVGKLPYDATEAELTALFESAGAGPVLRVTLPAGPDGRPRGFGFVTLASEEATNVAIDKLNGASVRGRPIVISKAQPKGKPGERPAGGPPQGGGYSGGGGHTGGLGGGYGGGQGAPRVDARPRRDDFGGGGGFDSMPPPPPPEDDGRARAGGKGRGGTPARKGGGAGGERGGRGGAGGGDRGRGKGPRGGGGNWHRWEEDD